jgi:hypothetical protein
MKRRTPKKKTNAFNHYNYLFIYLLKGRDMMKMKKKFENDV